MKRITFTDSEAFCHACEQWKPLNEFYRRSDPRYVRPARSHCKACERQSAIDRYHRDPRRSVVTVLVGRAVSAGKLQRGPCEVCGDLETQAHHDDYGKPLDVRWLCVSHHLKLHRAAA